MEGNSNVVICERRLTLKSRRYQNKGEQDGRVQNGRRHQTGLKGVEERIDGKFEINICSPSK